MNKRQYVEAVIEHCRDLAEGTVQPDALWLGLCAELRCAYSIRGLIIVFKDFHADAKVEPTAFNLMYPIKYGQDNWGDNSTGDARRELCDYIADWFEENIEEILS
jgi:hypothetical protein